MVPRVAVFTDVLDAKLVRVDAEVAAAFAALLDIASLLPFTGVMSPTAHTSCGTESGPHEIGLQPGRPVRLPCTVSFSTDVCSGQVRG